jgi:hypothetical protein
MQFLYQAEGVDHHCPLTALIESEEATEQGEAIDFSEIGAIPKDALTILLRLILPSSNPLTSQYWRTASVRLCTTAAALNIHPVGGHSLTDLAKAIGCSRAALSFAAVNLRDFANLGHRGGRCDAARDTYSRATREAWIRRKKESSEA